VLLNQGFYNLLLAVAGIVGLRSIKRGADAAGYALVFYMCLSALGAGIVLALSTRAYLGAVLQSAPAAFALVSLRHAPRSLARR
jgi:putative membrane protein